ncbi:hypothetical protein Tco_0344350 [Tanacetum coccineum]
MVGALIYLTASRQILCSGNMLLVLAIKRNRLRTHLTAVKRESFWYLKDSVTWVLLVSCLQKDRTALQCRQKKRVLCLYLGAAVKFPMVDELSSQIFGFHFEKYLCIVNTQGSMPSEQSSPAFPYQCTSMSEYHFINGNRLKGIVEYSLSELNTS